MQSGMAVVELSREAQVVFERAGALRILIWRVRAEGTRVPRPHEFVVARTGDADRGVQVIGMHMIVIQ